MDGVSTGKYLPKFCDFVCSDGVPPHFEPPSALGMFAAPRIPHGTPTFMLYPQTLLLCLHYTDILCPYPICVTKAGNCPNSTGRTTSPGQPGHRLAFAPRVWDGAEDVCPGHVLHWSGG